MSKICRHTMSVKSDEFWNTATLRHFRPLLQKIYRNRIPENFLLTEIWTSNAICQKEVPVIQRTRKIYDKT